MFLCPSGTLDTKQFISIIVLPFFLYKYSSKLYIIMVIQLGLVGVMQSGVITMNVTLFYVTYLLQYEEDLLCTTV